MSEFKNTNNGYASPACVAAEIAPGDFDRALSGRSGRPFAVGFGFQSVQITAICPRAREVPIQMILAEAGIQAKRATA